jgi:BNR repeat-like domain
MCGVVVAGRLGFGRGRVVGLVFALVMLGASAGTASATAATPSAASAWSRGSSPTVTSVREIAGQSPFIGQSCNATTSPATSPGGQEATPFIAVNPRDPRNRIAAWMDATRATVDTAYSTDGGRSWQVVIPQGIDNCTGNNTNDGKPIEWEASGPPLISFGPDGVAYLSTITWAHFVTPPLDEYVSVVHVSTSTDGGRSWSRAVLVSGPESVASSPVMVVADPKRPGVAYEIWANEAFGLPVGARGAINSLYFQMTSDHGATWSAPRAIDTTVGANDVFDTQGLSVLDDGTLVATSSLPTSSLPNAPNMELSWRSTDHGQTWQGPTFIRFASAGSTPAICGETVFEDDSLGASGPQQVLDGRSVLFITRDGAAAAAGAGKIVLSRSDDGGLTWHSSTVYRSSQPIIMPSIAVNHRQIGLVFDQIDTADVNCTTGTVPTRSEFAVASVHDHRHVTFGTPVTLGAESWNLESGLRGGAVGLPAGVEGYLFGDYQTLAATPGGFTTATAQGQPLAPGGPPLTGLNGVIVANVSTRGDG